MADVTISTILKGAKNPAIVGIGFLGGIALQKCINKIFNSETVVQGLGADTATGLKKYATPLITTAIGVAVSIGSSDDLIKKLGTGAAISGTVNVGTQLFWSKNLLSGMSGGIMGSILGTDDDLDAEDGFSGVDDDDDLGDVDDEELGDLGDYDEEEVTPIAALDIPIQAPPMRDTEYEKETITGYDNGLIL